MVSSEFITELFGSLGVIMGICFMISPLHYMIEGVNKGEIKGIQFSFLTLNTINSCFWLVYAMKIEDSNLAIVNSFGLFMNIIYITMYLYVLNKSDKISFYIGLIIAIIYFLYELVHAEIIGGMASALIMVLYASMYANVRETLQTKNPESINLLLTLIAIVNTFCWTSYGYIISNKFIYVPYFFCFISNVVSIFVYFWSIDKFDDNHVLINVLKKTLMTEKVSIDNRILLDF